VAVGCDYRLEAILEGSAGRRYASKEISVQPGEVTEAGDLRRRND
jgi:hypothetical protein